MPIRPENRDRYPANWRDIAKGIKEQAGWRCECMGECHSQKHTLYGRLAARDPMIDGPRCPNRHGRASEFTGATVVLTVAHLDHTPENCDPENLRAMCQGCHLNYDRAHHAETRAGTRRAAVATQSEPMF